MTTHETTALDPVVVSAPTDAPPQTWSAGAVAVVAGLLLAAAVGLVAAAALGGSTDRPLLGDPGPVVRWGAPAGRVLLDVSAVVTVGCQVVAVLLRRPSARASVAGGRAQEVVGRLLATSGRAAAVWAVAAGVSAVLVLAETAALPLRQTVAPDVLPLALDLPQTRALLLTAWLAALVAVGTRWAGSPMGAALLSALTVAALLPPVLAGHAGHDEGRTLAVAALLTHLVAAAAWTGGLAALVLHLRRSPLLAAVLPSFSRLALVCCLAVAASGVVAASTRLTAIAELWTSGYGRIVLAKAAALVLVAALGAVHRRRAMPALAAGRGRPFLRLVLVELVVLAGTAGLAGGLSRTEPPETPSSHVSAAADVHGAFTPPAQGGHSAGARA